MATTNSKTGRLSETLWSVLMLICIGLIGLHLATAVADQTSPDETLIDRTFTSVPADQEGRR